MVIHRRLRPASYRRADTGETRRTSSRKHVLRTTGPYVYTSSLSPRPPRLLLLVSTQFLLRLRRNIRLAGLAGSSFRSARFSASNCPRKREEREGGIEKRELPRGPRRTTNEPYSPNPANSNRTESEESVCRRNSFSLLRFTSSLFRFSLSDRFLRSSACFHHPLHTSTGIRLGTRRKLARKKKRTFAAVEFLLQFYVDIYTRKRARENKRLL